MLTAKMRIHVNSKVLRIVCLILAFLSIAESAKRLNGFSQGPIVCPIRLLTNIPCPACGTTRSIGSIAIGDFDRAWNLNPLGYLVYLLAIIWAIFPGLITKILHIFDNKFSLIQSNRQFIYIFLLYLGAWLITTLRANSGIV